MNETRLADMKGLVCASSKTCCIFPGPGTRWVIVIRSYKPPVFFVPGKITNMVFSIPHAGLLNLQWQNITPFNAISRGVFEFNLVPAPLKMTHHSAMIAKLSPIDSAVALKPGRGCCWQPFPGMERRRGERRE